MSEVVIRRIEGKDYKDIHALNAKLGYEYEESKVYGRIMNLLDTGTDIISVAEVDGNVIGYIHGNPYNTLYADNLMNIVVMVFSQDCDEEIKTSLYEAFEQRVIKNGYHGLRMAADIEREGLYDFMLKQGFDNKRSLKHYIKYYK